VGIDAFVNADVVAQGLSGFRPDSAAREAGRIVLERLRSLAAARDDFAIESTLAGRSLARFLGELARAGYERHLLYLWLPVVDLAIERVRMRVRAGGHDVPEDTIRRRFEKSLKNLFTLYMPVCTSWRLYDGTVGTDRRLIAFGGATERPEVRDQKSWTQIQEQLRDD
jgi:predicted ABC-type ATPase